MLGGVTVIFVDRPLHDAAAAAQLLAGRRGLSLVDCTSFQLVGRHGIGEVFVYDRHFQERGFTPV